MIAVRKPGRASGKATLRKRSQAPARKVAATSSGRLPIASNAFWIGCTANGSENSTEPTTRPAKVNGKVPMFKALVIPPTAPCGPISNNK